MLNRYRENLVVRQTNTGTRYYGTVLTSPIPQDVFEYRIIAKDGDRFDTLATLYYKDASKWWIIAKANNLSNGTMFIPGGTELIIPSAGLL